MIRVERIQAHQADLLRNLRLRTLQDAPDAFLETYANAIKRPIDEWEARKKLEYCFSG